MCLCCSVIQWVAATDSPSKQGPAIRIENRNQFAPQGSNPKEFIQQQRQVAYVPRLVERLKRAGVAGRGRSVLFSACRCFRVIWGDACLRQSGFICVTASETTRLTLPTAKAILLVTES